MTIHIPKSVLIVVGVLFGAYMAYEEAPAMYRYLFKFEAM